MIWLRQWVMMRLKQYTGFYAPPEVSRKVHDRLSKVYIFITWNVFIISYLMYRNSQDKNKSLPEDISKAHKIARQFQLKNPTIYRVSPSGVTTEQIQVVDYDPLENGATTTTTQSN